MSWLVDAHVHYHPCFGWDRFLAGAADHLDRAAARRPGDEVTAGCLLFVHVAGEPTLVRLRTRGAEGDRTLPARWTLRETAEDTAIRLERTDGAPLLLVQGRQVATREGLEVLALACGRSIPDGLDLEATVDAALEAGAVAVIPWGFGKWWLRRGRILGHLLGSARGDRVHLGDNGNRPARGPTPAPFRAARERGRLILPGSDPLPFDHHARRALSYGFWMTGELDPDRPGASLRAWLRTDPPCPRPVGRLRGTFGFVADQLRMQLRPRAAGSSGPPSHIEATP